MNEEDCKTIETLLLVISNDHINDNIKTLARSMIVNIIGS
jgi:hypothetical protein